MESQLVECQLQNNITEWRDRLKFISQKAFLYFLTNLTWNGQWRIYFLKANHSFCETSLRFSIFENLIF
jgi:hypothetical protein